MQQEHNTLYIGTYTKGTSEGIYIYDFDSAAQTCRQMQVVPTANPSYLALDADRKNMYAVNESSDLTGDMLSAFRQNGTQWEPAHVTDTKGVDPCYVSLGGNKEHIFTANYSNGSLSVFTLDEQGVPAERVQFLAFSGSGPNTERQEASHIHCAQLAPDGEHLFVCDLGTDKVYVYRYDAANATPLTALEPIATAPGSGPRHIVFNQSGSMAYVILELNATVNVYEHKAGKLDLVQTAAMEASDYRGANCAAAIHLSEDGKFLYASNRGDANSISVFAVAAASGKLTFTERVSTAGAGPRDFLITPCDGYLLVANQYSNAIQLFERDKTSGRLAYVKKLLDVDSPVCLKM